MGRASRHARWEVGGGAVEAASDPVIITGGAVTAWLRNNTVGAISSVPDVLNPSNPAVQTVAGRKPTGNADGSMSFDGGDVLEIAYIAANSGTVAFGIGLWLRLTGVSAVQMPWTQEYGGNRGRAVVADGAAGSTYRIGGDAGGNTTCPGGTLTAGLAVFASWEFDGSAALGSRSFLFINGVKVNTTDTLGSPLATASGTWMVGASSSAGNNGMLGATGRNIYIYGAKTAGATQGLLTTTGRLALENLEPLP